MDKKEREKRRKIGLVVEGKSKGWQCMLLGCAWVKPLGQTDTHDHISQGAYYI